MKKITSLSLKKTSFRKVWTLDLEVTDFLEVVRLDGIIQLSNELNLCIFHGRLNVEHKTQQPRSKFLNRHIFEVAAAFGGENQKSSNRNFPNS